MALENVLTSRENATPKIRQENMKLTRKQLADMKEAQLQKDVLIPLFKAMKFRSVTLYDGGDLELGKDIVMWKEGDLHDRINYGVVVKARKISGRATGKGSANEIYFQILQCFSAPFLDLASTEEKRVHRCWVVSSKEIKKEAINAIRARLRDDNLDRVTTFVDGDRLSELIHEFMPEQGVLEQLESVQKKIEEVVKSDHYRIIANTKQEFSIETRYPGAEKDQPFLISTRFEFDSKDPEGRKSLDDWLHHVKTGAPVTIKAPHLKEFSLPEFLRPLIKPSTEDMQLTIGPSRTDKRITSRLEIRDLKGNVATLDYLDFEVVQAGTDEVTLSNERQSVPWKLTLVIKSRERQLDLNYKLMGERWNVTQALQALRFQHAIAEGGELVMVNLESGFEVRVPFAQTRSKPMDDGRWIKLLEELVFIQTKASVLLSLPDGEIAFDEVKTIFVTAQIIRTGRATGSIKSWPVQSKITQANAALAEFSNKTIHSLTMNDKTDHRVTILGAEICLGPAVLFCERAYITKADLAKLKKDIESANPEDMIHYKIMPYKGCSTEARYLNWLPEAEAAELRKLPIFRDEPTC